MLQEYFRDVSEMLQSVSEMLQIEKVVLLNTKNQNKFHSLVKREFFLLYDLLFEPAPITLVTP